jgi:hypothetical protein
MIGFIHCAPVPKMKGTTTPFPQDPNLGVSLVCNRLRHLSADHPQTANLEEGKLYKEMGAAAQQAMPTLMKGKGAEQEVGDWLVVTRPVRAMKASCLKCHQGAKLGDTLGALAYVVSKQTFATTLPAPSRIAPAAGNGRGL